MTDDRPLELRLADQEWLTEDARECARLPILWLPVERQRAILEDETFSRRVIPQRTSAG